MMLRAKNIKQIPLKEGLLINGKGRRTKPGLKETEYSCGRHQCLAGDADGIPSLYRTGSGEQKVFKCISMSKGVGT